MLQSNPDINLIVGSDQGIEGAVRVVGKKVVLVGLRRQRRGEGGILSGRWYGSVWQVPATEGRLAAAVRDQGRATRARRVPSRIWRCRS